MSRTVLMRVAAFALLWLILAEGQHNGWVMGAVAVISAIWASTKLLPPSGRRIRLAGLPDFLRFFLWNSIRGGIQVAGMALRGRAALQPSLIELPVTVPTGGARILLMSVLGLMPGTLGVDLSDTTLRLHVLDERLPVIAEAQMLEAVIGKLFVRPA